MVINPEVLRHAQAGDRDAQGRLVADLWPDAYRIARIACGVQLAEDAAQEACIEMLAALSGLRSPAAFPSWFYRIVVRAAYRELRRTRRDVPTADLAERAASADPQARLSTALDLLPRVERVALVLRYEYGFTSAEIGAIVGIPAGTVRYRMWNAKRRLKAMFLRPADMRGDVDGRI